MKLPCYIVKDLLPNYIDDILSEETKNDVTEHLNHCEKCQKELDILNSPIEMKEELNKNKKDVEYLGKYHKKYSKTKKIIVFLSIICCCLFVGGTIAVAGWAYQLQYNTKGVSNYINVSFSDVGLEKIGEYDSYKVYTYNIETAYFIDFGANEIQLKDSLEQNKVTIESMIKHLEKTETLYGSEKVNIYSFENYQIIIKGEVCLIAPMNIETEEIWKMME